MIPSYSGTYFEPFLGAGALYFQLRPPKAYLSDINAELINAYQQVRDNIEPLVTRLQKLRHNKKTFSTVANSSPKTELGRAVRFIYLNRTSWNGLYRVNAGGRFNVPIGKHKYPTICDEPMLRRASNTLATAQLVCCDFEEILNLTKPKDLIYLDPPYATSSKNGANGFTSYNSKLFSLTDQERLASVAHQLVNKGCLVLISNSAHATIDALFERYYRLDLTRASRIAGIVEKRTIVKERLFASFPLKLLEDT